MDAAAVLTLFWRLCCRRSGEAATNKYILGGREIGCRIGAGSTAGRKERKKKLTSSLPLYPSTIICYPVNCFNKSPILPPYIVEHIHRGGYQIKMDGKMFAVSDISLCHISNGSGPRLLVAAELTWSFNSLLSRSVRKKCAARNPSTFLMLTFCTRALFVQ